MAKGNNITVVELDAQGLGSVGAIAAMTTNLKTAVEREGSDEEA